MKDVEQIYSGLDVRVARHGGYIVFPSTLERGFEREPLFAGELSSCLLFIEKRIAQPPAA